MAAILYLLGYMEATKSLKYPYKLIRDTCPSREKSEIFVIAPSDGCPATTNLLSLDTSLAIPMRVVRFKVSGLRRRTPVRPVLLTGQTGPMLLHLHLRFFGLGFVDQPRNPVVFW
jgi:hypothetical protein